jgi:hypothetical protein
MKNADTELLEVSRKLSPSKRRELIDYGRKLYSQKDKKAGGVEEAGDAAWKRIINDARPRPKLKAYMDRILREEKAEPMDSSKL